jgi:hypothetical protein
MDRDVLLPLTVGEILNGMRNFAEKENWFRSLKLAPKSTAQLNSLVA